MIHRFGEQELIDKAISELKEISYILEDEGFEINYEISKNTYTGYAFLYILRWHPMNYEFQKNVKKSEYWLEYIDRVKEILNVIGFYPRLVSYKPTPKFITLVIEKLSPRQKRRMLNKK